MALANSHFSTGSSVVAPDDQSRHDSSRHSARNRVLPSAKSKLLKQPDVRYIIKGPGSTTVAGDGSEISIAIVEGGQISSRFLIKDLLHRLTLSTSKVELGEGQDGITRKSIGKSSSSGAVDPSDSYECSGRPSRADGETYQRPTNNDSIIDGLVPLFPYPNVAGVSLDRSEHERLLSISIEEKKRFALDDQDAIRDHIKETFRLAHQNELKPILKAMIKFIEPNKQGKWPYVWSADKAHRAEKPRLGKGNDGNLRPPWWPESLDHREPDHLKKDQNATLGVALIWHVAMDVTLNRKYDDRALDRLFLDHLRQLNPYLALSRDHDGDEAAASQRDNKQDQDGAIGYDNAMDVRKDEDQSRAAIAPVERNIYRGDSFIRSFARIERLTGAFKLAIHCSAVKFGQIDPDEELPIRYHDYQSEHAKQKKAQIRKDQSQQPRLIDGKSVPIDAMITKGIVKEGDKRSEIACATKRKAIQENAQEYEAFSPKRPKQEPEDGPWCGQSSDFVTPRTDCHNLQQDRIICSLAEEPAFSSASFTNDIAMNDDIATALEDCATPFSSHYVPSTTTPSYTCSSISTSCSPQFGTYEVTPSNYIGRGIAESSRPMLHHDQATGPMLDPYSYIENSVKQTVSVYEDEPSLNMGAHSTLQQEPSYWSPTGLFDPVGSRPFFAFDVGSQFRDDESMIVQSNHNLEGFDNFEFPSDWTDFSMTMP